MDVREKLVAWLCEAMILFDKRKDEKDINPFGVFADHLIAHGVTVQSEIDANTYQLMREIERLKEEKESLANAVNVLEEINSDLLKQIKGVTVQEWISVKDGLPDNKEHDWVLAQVVEDNGFMHIPKVMEYRQQRNDWYEETYGWLSEHNGAFTVTHWMPLPQPPKGE